MAGPEKMQAPDGQPDGLAPLARPQRAGLLTAMAWVVIAGVAWYLLKELTTLLRPLLLAIFLGYIILPLHLRLSKRISRAASVVVMVAGTVGLLFLLGWMIRQSVVGLEEDLPRLTRRAEDIAHQVQEFLKEKLPALAGPTLEDDKAKELRARKIHEIAKVFFNAAAGFLGEAVVVGFYLLFLLLEASHFPQRVRSAFGGERATQVHAVAENINQAIARYLHVKTKASLLLAVPVAVVLWVFGVKFALLWGVLTFLCNFIPYIGSIIAVTLPLLFAFLAADPGLQPVAAALGVVSIHVVMTYLVEPALVGKGVGLSPLVILIALAFWGECWGLVGMFLAIPLTVVLKIVLENVASTRPVARLLADD
jgi:AI-2 transport protein TqsA